MAERQQAIADAARLNDVFDTALDYLHARDWRSRFMSQLFLVNRDRAHTLRLLRLPHMGSERVTNDSTR